jgi:hypothetical protein
VTWPHDPLSLMKPWFHRVLTPGKSRFHDVTVAPAGKY